MLKVLSYVPMYTSCISVKRLEKSNIFTNTWFSSAQTLLLQSFL